MAFALFTLPALLGSSHVGPVFAAIQTRTQLQLRAVAASIHLFIGNIIGLGAGPFYVGFMSDQLAPGLTRAHLPSQPVRWYWSTSLPPPCPLALISGEFALRCLLGTI